MLSKAHNYHYTQRGQRLNGWRKSQQKHHRDAMLLLLPVVDYVFQSLLELVLAVFLPSNISRLHEQESLCKYVESRGRWWCWAWSGSCWISNASCWTPRIEILREPIKLQLVTQHTHTPDWLTALVSKRRIEKARLEYNDNHDTIYFSTFFKNAAETD